MAGRAKVWLPCASCSHVCQDTRGCSRQLALLWHDAGRSPMTRLQAMRTCACRQGDVGDVGRHLGPHRLGGYLVDPLAHLLSHTLVIKVQPEPEQLETKQALLHCHKQLRIHQCKGMPPAPLQMCLPGSRNAWSCR